MLSEVNMSLIVSIAALSDPEPIFIVVEGEFDWAFVTELSGISTIFIVDFHFCLVFNGCILCRLRFDFIRFEGSKNEVIGQDLSVEVVESSEGLVN